MRDVRGLGKRGLLSPARDFSWERSAFTLDDPVTLRGLSTTTAAPSLPDLRIDDVEIEGDAIDDGDEYGPDFRAGDEVRLDWDVDNRGSATAGASEVGIFLRSSSDGMLVDTNATASIGPGGSDTNEYDSFVIPSTLDPGLYRIVLLADHKNQIVESSESNNVFTIWIRVVAAGKPDLAFDNVEIEGDAISSGHEYGPDFKPGDRVRIDWDVDNRGNGDAGSSRVAIYLRSAHDGEIIATNATDAIDAGESDTGQWSEFTIPSALDPGLYTLELVADYQGNVSESNESNNSYRILIRVASGDSPPPGSADQVREGTDTAHEIDIGGTVNGRIDAEPISGDGVTSDQQGGMVDKDWYEVTLERGHVYTFNGSSSSLTTGQIVISLYANANTRLRGPTEGSSPSFTFDTNNQAGATQTYYFAVSAGGPESAWRTATGNYSLSVVDNTVNPPPSTDDFRDDPDDTSAPLGDLDIDQSLTGFIGPADSNDDFGDKDVFAVELTAGQIYDFRLRSSTVDGSALSAVLFTIRDDDFDQLERSGSGADVHEIFRADRTGLYYVRVGSGGSSADIGGYRLDVNTIQPSQIPDDWADDPSDVGVPGPLSPGGSGTGIIESAGDKDYFTVTLQAGKVYHFSVDAEDRSGTGAIGTLAMSLRGPNSFNTNYLGFDDGSGRAGFDVEITVTGTYYVRVGAGDDGADTGGYRVSVGNPRPVVPEDTDPVPGPGTPQDVHVNNWIDEKLYKATSVSIWSLEGLFSVARELLNGMDGDEAIRVIRHLEKTFTRIGIGIDVVEAIDNIVHPKPGYTQGKAIFVEITTLMAGFALTRGTLAGGPLGVAISIGASGAWEWGVDNWFRGAASSFYDFFIGSPLQHVTGSDNDVLPGDIFNSSSFDEIEDLVVFDENYYLTTYPDVADGLREGRFASAYAHFLGIGVNQGYRPNPSDVLQPSDLVVRLLNNDPLAANIFALFTQLLNELAGDGIGSSEQAVANALSMIGGVTNGAMLDGTLSAIAHRKALDLAANTPGDTIKTAAQSTNSAWALQWSDGSDFDQLFAGELEALLGGEASEASYRLFVVPSSTGTPADVLARLQAQEGWNSGSFDTFGIAEFGGHWVVIVADRAPGVNAVVPGNDTLTTASIYGSGGDEFLYAGMRAGRLFGLDGNDTLVAGTGVDYLDGGQGDDIYAVNGVDDRVIEGVGGGRDTVFARVSYTLATDAEVEIFSTIDYDGTTAMNLTGNAFAQEVWGNAGINILDGGGGADWLFGGDGIDALLGGDGDDHLYGDGGGDRLTGGAGADHFMFESITDSRSGALRSDGTKLLPDVILDFTPGEDKIDLSPIEPMLSAGVHSFTFIGTNAFSKSAGQVRYEVRDGYLNVLADADGDGWADMMFVVMGTSLQASDFVL